MDMPANASLVHDDYGNVVGGRAHIAISEPGAGGRARGLHNPAETYFAMDVVSFNGSEWRAIRDDPGELPGSGWHLGAKGARGKPGPPGVHVTGIETVGYCVVLSAGQRMERLRSNMLPALERFKKETT